MFSSENVNYAPQKSFAALQLTPPWYVVCLGPSRAKRFSECGGHDNLGVCSFTHSAQERHVPQQAPLRLAPRS